MITNINSMVEQLVNIYYQEEWWHKSRISREEAYKYHKKLLDQGNIILYVEEEKVVGYAEFWRVNYHQWGRMVCGETLSGYLENITDGNICVVHNVWIKKDAQRGKVFKDMMRRFYALNSHCDYYVGHALRKRTQPIKVFKRSNLKSSIFTKGV